MFQGRFIRQKMGVFYFDFFLKDLQVKIPEVSAGGIRMLFFQRPKGAGLVLSPCYLHKQWW